MKCPYDGYAMEFLASFTGSPAYWCPGCEKSFEEDSPELGPPEAPQNSSNEAKTPLANVSGSKDNLETPYELKSYYALNEIAGRRGCSLSHLPYVQTPKARQELIDWLTEYDKRLLLPTPITQPTASVSAPTTTVIDHSQASLPECLSPLPDANESEALESMLDRVKADYPNTGREELSEIFHATYDRLASESSISSTLHDEMEREAMRLTIDELAAKVESLRSIIDSLKAEKEALRKEVTAWRNGEQEISAHDAASNMKAAILQRVQDFDDWVWCECSECKMDGHAHAVDTRASLPKLATELESIQLKDEDKNEQS